MFTVFCTVTLSAFLCASAAAPNPTSERTEQTTAPALAASPASGPATLPAPASVAPALLLPEVLHLGAVAPGDSVAATLWLINTGDAPMTIDSVRGTCGCTRISAQPVVIRARHAAPLRIEVTLGHDADPARDRAITIEAAGATHRVPLDLVTASEEADEHKHGSVAEGASLSTLHPILRTAPESGGTSGSIWIINTGERTVTLERLTASCGCLTLPDFAPREVRPGEAVDITVVRSTNGTSVPKPVVNREVRVIAGDSSVSRVRVTL